MTGPSKVQALTIPAATPGKDQPVDSAAADAAVANGFTLIEILVALLIFAIIGVISSQLLSQTVSSHATLTERGNRLGDTHRAMQIIQRDIMQLANRGIRGQFGDQQPALLIDPDGTLEFSRLGWRNPLGQPRAEVQRVGYRLRNNELLRGYWTVLDRSPDSEPTYQTLLTEVERLEFYALDSRGDEHKHWPPFTIDPPPGNSQTPILVGLLLRIELAPFGMVERVWEVPDV